MSLKKWKINQIDKQASLRLSQETGCDEFLCDILVSRGITTFEKMQQFFDADLTLEDPFALIDMDVAVERIKTAIEQGEKIAIYGDYDCDGVTATVILYSYLDFLGADVTAYIPKRIEEGYGMNVGAIDELAKQGVSLIITVDNGISAIKECEHANSLGIDVIVTDHHQVGDVLPDAVAVVNPHRKDCPSAFKQLCGAGVAFKLITALEDGDYEAMLENYGDLVAIGTIGDVVTLTGENRVLVKRGLEMLQNTENQGLLALIEASGLLGKELTAQSVAFAVAPRINAAGRIGDAQDAVKMLLCDAPDEAYELATKICAYNQQRQNLEKEIMLEIEKQIADNPKKLNNRVLVLWGENWHHGVIGIVSARVVEKYAKPAILLCVDGQYACGSARSFGEFSLYHALLSCEDLLVRYGGHKQAAGMMLEVSNLEQFETAINEYARKNFPTMPSPELEVDMSIKPSQITVENIEKLDALEPFGTDNQLPLFVVEGATITSISPLAENKHIKIGIKCGSANLQAIYFRMSTDKFMFSIGQMVDIVANIDINEFRGNKSVSIKVKDIRPTGFVENQYFSAKAVYENLLRKEPIDAKYYDKIIPNRDEFALVYRVLKTSNGYNNDIDYLFYSFADKKINYCKFCIILNVMQEMKLVTVSQLKDSIKLLPAEQKIDLEASRLLTKLKTDKAAAGE